MPSQTSTANDFIGTLQETDQQIHPDTTRMHQLQQLWTHGHHIMGGLLALRQSRRLYGEIRDVPKALQHMHVQEDETIVLLETLMLIAFLLVHVSWLLWKKRYSQGKGKPSNDGSLLRHGYRRRLELRVICSASCVYGHCMWYHIAGEARPFGGRLALVFVVLGLDAMRKHWSIAH